MTTAHDVADALYGQPPQGFTAARDARVAAARTAGEKALAAELAALKRPSQSAWLVNLLALRRPETVERLVALGQTIREAQGSVTPQQLRDLSAQRRSALDGALALAGSLAVAAGEPAPSRAQLAEVEGTLAAAMADPAAAALVGAGRVLKALVYSGFGGPTGADGSGVASLAAGRTATRAVGPGTGTRATPGTPAGEGPAAATTAERERAQQAAVAAEAEAATARLAAATDRVEQARRAHAGAVEAEREVQGQTEALTAEIAAASARLDGLHRDARAARQARLAAERDLASAQRRLERLAEPS